MIKKFKAYNSSITFDDQEVFGQQNISNMHFVKCTFKNLKLDKLDITHSKFEKCVFENVHVNELIGHSEAKLIECTFFDCSIALISYIDGMIRGCSFVFSQ